jgi:2-polyprenyl-3-methyl-5-hydroxy-6-metoxy-1,4-benzoquinol methylase
MLAARGVAVVGIDPTAALIAHAQSLHPDGDYRVAAAETMMVDGGFDVAVCYLSLIDMPDLVAALARIVAAIRPGGHLLIANLTAFNTAAVHLGWVKPLEGEPFFPIDHYLAGRPVRTTWRGIDIWNHHRPLKRYMQALIGHGLVLTHSDEPPATGGTADKLDRYNRVPNFHIMCWRKPL